MMRLIALASVALSGTWCAHGALTVMGNYEIRPAGDGSSNPFAKVLTVEPFVFETYFESASSVPGVATFELFANAADGKPCSTGTAISNSTFNVSFTTGPYYNKTGSNSRIFAAQYSIPDVTTTPAYANGTVDLCARTGIKKDIDSATKGLEYVSYVDTLLELNVDLVAKFSNFSQIVNITSTAMGNLTENVTKSVAVDAVLCAMDNFAPSSYKIGQDFSICVSPTVEYYSIANFTNVTCENSASSRQLVVNSKPDTLTTTKLNPVGYTNTSGGAIGGEFGVFSSVVTAGYFGGGETSFSCSGEVALGYNPPCKKMGFALLDSQLLSQPETNQYGYIGSPMCIAGKVADPRVMTELLATGFNGIPYKRIDGFTQETYLFGNSKSPLKFTSSIGNCDQTGVFLQPERPPTQADFDANKADPMKLYALFPNKQEGDPVEVCFALPVNITFGQQTNFLNLYTHKSSTTNKFTSDGTEYEFHCTSSSPPNEIKLELRVQCLDSLLGRGRRLLESVGFSGLFRASTFRNLQELEKDTFSATVGLSDDGLDALSAPAMILRSGVATSIVFGTGLLSLFLAAM